MITNATLDHANKFNQLRETMNQLFLANPELAEEIKFEQYQFADEPDIESPKNTYTSSSPAKHAVGGGFDSYIPNPQEEQGTNPASTKFWSVISKEMTKPQKNTKIPPLSQINHVLNIFKTKFERVDTNEANISPAKSAAVLKKAKSDFRIQSAKLNGDKYSGSKQKDGKNQAQASIQGKNPGAFEEEEDGVAYYSSRKKMHLKLKQKRMEREMEEQQIKKELEAEREKLAKEREQEQMMSTLAELDGQIKKGIQNARSDADHHLDAGSSRNTTKLGKIKPLSARKESLKPKENIFDRLTNANKNAADEEEDPVEKKKFLSPFAKSLYEDMLAFGDAEAFKKMAQAKIMLYKKDFKDKLAKQKQNPTEGLKFNKEKSRHLNMFLPDFERVASIQNKDAVFVTNEVQRDSEEWKSNPENEILAKFQKILHGNILEFWQDTKDLNQ